MSSKSSDERLPYIDKALLTALDSLFPERSADLQWSDRDVWFKAGQRAVVKFLIYESEQQNMTKF